MRLLKAKRRMSMKFKHKNPDSTLKWFIIAMIPIVNTYFYWRLAKMIANTETERGD